MWRNHQSGSIRGSPSPSRTEAPHRAPDRHGVPLRCGHGRCGGGAGGGCGARREVSRLPKAHLHLHFTGSMRHGTLLELAERDGIVLPDSLVEDWPPQLQRGRREGLVPLPAPLRRGALGAAHARRRTTSGAARRPRTTSATAAGGWRSRSTRAGYAARFGGITEFTDLVLDCVRDASRAHRARHGGRHRRQPHPPPARRPHARAPGRPVRRPGRRRLRAVQRRASRPHRRTSRPAFRIAERAGLLLVPHGGELRGPDHVRQCLDGLGAHRLGHGVRGVEDPALLDRLVESGVALEVCPVSNVSLGVYSDLTSVPLPAAARRRRHGRPGRRRPAALRLPARRRSTPRCAPRTTSTTMTLARLAEMSFTASQAPSDVGRRRWPTSPPGSPLTPYLRTSWTIGAADPSTTYRVRVSERAADRHRLVDERDAEALAHAVAHLAGEGRAARRWSRRRGWSGRGCAWSDRRPGPRPAGVALAEAGLLDEPRGAGLHRRRPAAPTAGRSSGRARPARASGTGW